MVGPVWDDSRYSWDRICLSYQQREDLRCQKVVVCHRNILGVALDIHGTVALYLVGVAALFAIEEIHTVNPTVFACLYQETASSTCRSSPQNYATLRWPQYGATCRSPTYRHPPLLLRGWYSYSRCCSCPWLPSLHYSEGIPYLRGGNGTDDADIERTFSVPFSNAARMACRPVKVDVELRTCLYIEGLRSWP